MTELVKGYYFIKEKNNTNWFIGYYRDGYLPWETIGSDETFDSAEFDIGPKIGIPANLTIEERE